MSIGFADLDDLNAAYRARPTPRASVSEGKNEAKQSSATSFFGTVDVDDMSAMAAKPNDEDQERSDMNFKNTASC